jgi:uncharacterized protein YjbJ (UPF0337 family)
MDKDRIRGPGKRAKGAAKEAIGEVTGNKDTATEGATERTAGKAQADTAKAKDAVRETIKQ